jgi:hypothetical protein
LLRFAPERGFHTSEIAGLGVAGTLILIFPYVTQVGLAAVSIVLALVIGRARTVARFTPQAP